MADETTIALPTTPTVGMVDVWDTDGKKHSMLQPNARDMIAHLGWFPSVPGALKEAAAKVVVLVSKKLAAEVEAATPENSEQVDLQALSIEALVKFAKVHFDMDFEATVSRESIINAILTEQGA